MMDRTKARDFLRGGQRIAGLLAMVGLACLTTGRASADSATTVFLNGTPTPVYFNDGDSFRVLEGPLQGTKARLAGFNTLESYGPAHQWGTWHAKELYAIAKMATYNARRGVWHCNSDLKRDGYGRILWKCPDLATDQMRHGFAHALTVTKDPAPAAYLRAQREAIEKRRGIWAHGIPALVLTSVHSADERPDNKNNYNRLVSSVDGHSEKWKHQNVFKECQNICHRVRQLPLKQLLPTIKALRADPATRAPLAGMADNYVGAIINTFVAIHEVPKVFRTAQRKAIADKLSALEASGVLPKPGLSTGSCMRHVGFRRRYIAPKPKCLKW